MLKKGDTVVWRGRVCEVICPGSQIPPEERAEIKCVDTTYFVRASELRKIGTLGKEGEDGEQ